MIFSERELRSLAQRLNASFHDARGERWFVLDAGEHDGDTWVQVLLRNDTNSFHYPVEARIAASPTKTRRVQAFFLLAFLDTYWEEFFEEDENVYIPIDWTAYEYQEEKFYLRGQILNLMAENMADRLLAETPSAGAPEKRHQQ